MFDISGTPTQVIANVKRYLSELRQMAPATHPIYAFLAEHNMFMPLNQRVRQSARVNAIAGGVMSSMKSD